jgi:hypothetical protein
MSPIDEAQSEQYFLNSLEKDSHKERSQGTQREGRSHYADELGDI